MSCTTFKCFIKKITANCVRCSHFMLARCNILLNELVVIIIIIIIITTTTTGTRVTCDMSHLHDTACRPGATADKAAVNRISKYCDLAGSHLFFSVAIEMAGTWNQMAVELVQQIVRWITMVTEEDTRETAFLFQHLSIALQWGNAVSFLSTFTATELTPTAVVSFFYFLAPTVFFLVGHRNNDDDDNNVTCRVSWCLRMQRLALI